MFQYGQDIPLHDVASGTTASADEPRPYLPMEFEFAYGSDIYPQPVTDDLQSDAR